MERDNMKADVEKYLIHNELSLTHATSYADTKPRDSSKKSFHETKRTQKKSHKTSLTFLFSRQTEKHNIPKQKTNNKGAKLSHGSLKSRNEFYCEPKNGKSSDSSNNLHRAKLSHSRQRTGWKSRLQSIQDSLRQSFRVRKDNNGNFEEHRWRKSSNEENGSRLHSKNSSKVTAGKITKRNNSLVDSKTKCVEIPTQNQSTCCDSTARGKKSCRKTSFVKRTLVNGSAVDNRKCEQDKLRKNNKVTRTKMFSIETSGQQSGSAGQLTELDWSCENKKKSRRAPFSKLWKTESLNFIGNFFKRPQSSKREENNHVEAVVPLKFSTSLSTANSTDLGFLSKRDPYLGSISSLEELYLLGSEEELYPWDFSDYIPGRRDKYRSLKRSRAALIFPQSINRSFSLDDVSVHSEQHFESGFSRLENTRSMDILGESHRSSSPYICIDFYNDDGSISPTSRSYQDICNEDSTDKIGAHRGTCPKTKIGTPTYLLDWEMDTEAGAIGICNQQLYEQSNLSRVSRSQEFCKCQLSQTDQNGQTDFGDEITTSKHLTSDQRELDADPKESSERVKKLNKVQGAKKNCFDCESDPKLFDMGNNQGSFNLIRLNSGHDLPAEKSLAWSENSKKVLNENNCPVFRQIEQTKVTHQRSFDDDAEIKKNVQCYGDKDLAKNKTPENESVKKCSICETKTEIGCKSPNKNVLSSSKSRPERKNAVSAFHVSNDIDFMRKTNILSSTEGGDKTFHAANGFVKSNARASFDSADMCQSQRRSVFSTQDNMALHLDLKSCHKFIGATNQNSVPENNEASRTSSGPLRSPEIRISGINSFEFQSLNQNNHLHPPSVDFKPETVGGDTVLTSSPATEHGDLQRVQERICPVCHKIKSSSTSPVEIKRPLPRYLSPAFSHSEIHLSKSLPTLHSPCPRNEHTSPNSQDAGSENGSPIDNPDMLLLSSSPESDSERRRASSAHTSRSVSPLLGELNTSNEYRSKSCTKLDEAGKSFPSSPPPQVTPRIKSLGQLAPISAGGRKIKLSRRRGRLSVPCVNGGFVPQSVIGKRHSISMASCNAAHDVQHLNQRQLVPTEELPNPDPKAPHCPAQCLSNFSLSSAATENDHEVSSTVSINSEVCTDSRHAVLGRSVSVPGHIYGSVSTSTLSIPEGENLHQKQWILTKGFSVDQSLPLTDESDVDDLDDEEYMDAPEAFAEALWDHVTMDPEELSFSAGDAITIISWTDTDWWWGQVGDRIGWFPAPFVRIRVSQTLACEEAPPATHLRSRRGTTLGTLSNSDVRSRVVEEILNTEKDYVKNLKDVVEGYLRQARKRPVMFSEEQLNVIFSNVEQIYVFHMKILQQLRAVYNATDPYASEIGAVFLDNKRGFDIYSEYCNNHPHAVAELKTMCESDKYKHFFEACRLLQEMINISLDGFLLTPVQKICKYPLQLAELLKHTDPDHSDYIPVQTALETMKGVATSINERKRKVECINKIAKWQSSIEGWEGEDVLQRSSELIYSGEVNKISKGNSQERVFFLFDHQIIYCKKDILKKNVLYYKGRVDMDSCNVVLSKDGEEHHNSVPLHNAWKMYNDDKEKWYIVYTKKPEQKDKWMKAFRDERARVKEDANSGVVIPQSTRRAAMRAAQLSIKGRKPCVKKEKLLPSPTIKRPVSPSSIPLPAPVSSADLKEPGSPNQCRDKDSSGFLQRTTQLRRSFGLRGSKKNRDKEKRLSSVF